MSTPLQRARTKLRVMYQLQQAAREHQRRSEDGREAAGSPVANGAEANHAQVWGVSLRSNTCIPAVKWLHAARNAMSPLLGRSVMHPL